MIYFNFLSQLLTGKADFFNLALEGKARLIMVINIVILGILFGFSNLVGSLGSTAELPMTGKFALITPALFSLFGIFTMLGALCGFWLIYWAAAKAFGGPGGLGVILELIGLAVPPFWILAPLMNYAFKFKHGETMPLVLLIPILLAFIWSFRLTRQSLVVGQGLASGRATLAVACMWIFSVSAIYVFQP